MKAASLSQPWCWATMDPRVRKNPENRSWAPPIAMIGQTFAIHAAKSWDADRRYQIGDEYFTPIGFLLYHGYEPPARRELYASGAIVGVATIDRIVTRPDTLTDEQKRWFFGPFAWVLADVRRLEEPIPWSGKQGLWTVPPDLEAGIWAQLPRAA